MADSIWLRYMGKELPTPCNTVKAEHEARSAAILILLLCLGV